MASHSKNLCWRTILYIQIHCRSVSSIPARRSFAKDVAPQVNDMIKWARDEHIPVIYTLHGADLRPLC